MKIYKRTISASQDLSLDRIVELNMQSERELNGLKTFRDAMRRLNTLFNELNSKIQYFIEDENLSAYVTSPADYPEDTFFEVHLEYKGKELPEQYFISHSGAERFNLSSISKGYIDGNMNINHLSSTLLREIERLHKQLVQK